MTVNGIKDWSNLSPAAQQYHRELQTANNTLLPAGQRKKAWENAERAKAKMNAEKAAA